MRRHGSSLFGVAAVLVAGCSGSSSAGGNAPGAACTGALAEQCGTACTGDAQCPVGLYCADDGECLADCSSDVPCADGSECKLRGQCATDSPPADGGADGNDNKGDAGTTDAQNSCVDIKVSFEEQIPSVLLLVDWSGSMNQDFGGTRRWDAVEEALVDPNDGVVAQLEDRVRFGILMYTSDDGNDGPTCPVLEGQDIPIGLNNYAAIAQLYDDIDGRVEDDTPTAEAVAAARERLVAFDEEGPKLLVLATDGDPDSCEDPDANGQDGPKRASEAEVQATFDAGIETRVIAVGEGTVEEGHLQNLANAGAGFATDGQQHATAYEPSDPASLVSAFNEIVSGVRSCVIDLDYALGPGAEQDGRVVLDGTPLQLGTDWQLRSNTEVELLGDACERLKEDASGLSITFPCDADVVPII